ncbi:MAG: O-antigen ligase family protein [Lentimicrobiaceae bacterium]|nr:O-antigen ligase family protein [Lentimicrobiaceae bacterium]
MFKRYCNSLITNWKENLYLLSLVAFLIALPTSIALISCTAVALLIVWIITGDYKTKWNRLIHNKSALLLISIPVIYLIGLCFTHNFSIGIQEFNKSLYWFIFAFVLSSSSPVSQKVTCRLLCIYIGSVAIAATVAFGKLIFLDTVQFFDFRAVTWVDHIPFSYQIAFSVWLIFYFILYGKLSLLKKTLLFLLITFLIIILFSLKSFNGYIYFGAISITALFLLMYKIKTKLLKFISLSLIVLMIFLPVFYIVHCVQKFYNTTEYQPDTIEKYTAEGNKYEHNFENKMKENGNYVGLFLCEEELIPLWNARSKRPYNDKTAFNYSLNSVIIRYMTSKGLTKDAAGFAQLSEKDIINIENELPNYIYAEKKWGVYPRIYETIWEIDQYRITKNPNGKSFAQRIELVVLAGKIIQKKFWFGVGLGNNPQVYQEIILETESNLTYSNIQSTHNQYFNYLVRFGFWGTLYILGVLFWVFFKERKNNPFLITIFFVSMLVANLGEANWETFIGLNYFAFFFCFLMWIVSKEKR